MGRNKHWTTQEDHILFQNYKSFSNKGLTTLLPGRSEAAIDRRLTRLNLCRRLRSVDTEFTGASKILTKTILEVIAAIPPDKPLTAQEIKVLCNQKYPGRYNADVTIRAALQALRNKGLIGWHRAGKGLGKAMLYRYYGINQPTSIDSSPATFQQSA